jgi:hypothetical protein
VSISKTKSRIAGDFSFNAKIPVALQAAISGLSDVCAFAAETAIAPRIRVLMSSDLKGTPELGETPPSNNMSVKQRFPMIAARTVATRWNGMSG